VSISRVETLPSTEAFVLIEATGVRSILPRLATWERESNSLDEEMPPRKMEKRWRNNKEGGTDLGHLNKLWIKIYYRTGFQNALKGSPPRAGRCEGGRGGEEKHVE